MISESTQFFFQILMVISTAIFILLTVRLLFQKKYIRELRNVILPENYDLWPKVSLIVPVCNEEQTVQSAALTLFKMDYPNIEFIFVNDRSTDNTQTILDNLSYSEPRMRVVHIQTLPTGWIGKLHAFHIGISHVTGDWILFSDADVHYNKYTLKKALYHSINNKLDFLGVIPSIVSPSFWSRLLLGQIIHYYSLYTNYNKISDPSSSAVAAHGAFMLVRKAAYEQSRGFEWLKMEIMDDVAFASEIKASGAKTDTLHGVDEVEFEWYQNIYQIVRGFEKNIFAALHYSYFNVLGANILFLGLFLSYTVGAFVIQNFIYILLIYGSLLAYCAVTTHVLKKIIQLPIFAVCLFPLTLLFFPFLILRSAFICLINQGIYWRGTFYSIHELRNGQRLKLLKNSRNSD